MTSVTFNNQRHSDWVDMEGPLAYLHKRMGLHRIAYLHSEGEYADYDYKVRRGLDNCLELTWRYASEYRTS